MHSDDSPKYDSSSRCPDCGRPRRAGDPLACHCSSPESEARDGRGEETEGLVSIARFRNIAEAGFFADELNRLDVSATVRTEDHFDAITGFWDSSCLLFVPAGRAEYALQALQNLIERSEGKTGAEADISGNDRAENPQDWTDASPFVGLDRTPDGDGGSGIRWVPIVLTLAAGSVVVWGLRQLDIGVDRNRPPRPANGARSELGRQLGTPEQPWTQPTTDGRGTRTLWFDRDRNRAVILERRNGLDERHEYPLETPAAP